MSQEKTPAEIPKRAPQLQEPRESVWSVRRKHADTFFATLFTLWIATAVMATVIHLNDHPKPAAMETAEWITRTAVDILLKLGAATIPVVMIAMIMNRPLTTAGGAIVITFEAAKARWVTPVIQKHEARGEVRGEAKGRAKGIAEANAQWEDWWNRRQAAEDSGLPFDEPPPSVS